MANPSTIFCSNFVAFLLCVQLEGSTFLKLVESMNFFDDGQD